MQTIAKVSLFLLLAGRAVASDPPAAPSTEPSATAVRPEASLTAWADKLEEQWAVRDAYGKQWQDRETPGPEIHVFGRHRQPAIVLTNEGTLLAFAEQYTAAGDVGDHEIVLRKSTDGGKTWGEQIVVFDDGRKNLNGPTPVVDRATGAVWLMFARSCKDILVTHSTDDGRTWVDPKVIESGDGFWPGQSHGIQLSSGRLLCPARIEGDGGFWCYYSDDHGGTWKKGAVTRQRNMNAILLSAVELSDGSIYGNMRQLYGRDPKYRRDTWSRDGGITWTHPQPNKSLRDADGGTGVKANVIRLTNERLHDRNRVVFCCPAEGGRVNPLVYVSYDECKTWSQGKQLLQGKFGYSDLVVLPDRSIGCLFEGGPGKGAYLMAFLRFNLDWLTDGKDKIVAKKATRLDSEKQHNGNQ